MTRKNLYIAIVALIVPSLASISLRVMGQGGEGWVAILFASMSMLVGAAFGSAAYR